jgi:hypothetical protein
MGSNVILNWDKKENGVGILFAMKPGEPITRIEQPVSARSYRELF